MAYIKLNRFLPRLMHQSTSMFIKQMKTPILFNRSRLMTYGGIITTAFGASYMLSKQQNAKCASLSPSAHKHHIDLCLVT